MIIDAHCHLGYDCVFDQEANEERLLANFEHFGIDGGIVQPYIPRPYIEEYRQIHDRIYRLTQMHPGKIFGMASMNPQFRPEDYDRETERCIRELGFVGIKITPPGHSCTPCSKSGMHVFEVAEKLDVPVMVHVGMGIPFSDTIKVQPCAESFPDVKIVLAHCGANWYTQQAIFLAQKYENIFLEPSGAGIEACADMVKAVGPAKIMFSSDVILQTATEVEKFRDLHRRGYLTEAGLEQIMYKTVQQVYRLDLKQ